MSSKTANRPAPVRQDELDHALARLELLQWRARENVRLQGRDPATAHVLLRAWRDALAPTVGHARFRLVWPELERRGAIRCDGVFVEVVR